MMKRFKFLALVAALGLPLAACDEGSQSTVIIEGSVIGVVTVDGTGVSATVTLSSGASTATDASGAYSFTGVPAGSYTVSISGTPSDAIFPSTSKGVVIQQQGETVTANFDGSYIRTSSIAGVVSADGMVLPGVTVTLGGDATDSKVTDGSGGYGFTGLRAGSYTVTISGFDANKYSFPTTSQPVSLSTGESGVVSFNGSANETGRIIATVTIDGAAANGVALTLSNGDTEVTNSSGQATFGGLATGTYAVTVTNPDNTNIQFDNLTQNATIAEIGGEAEVSFAGETIANASITGRVYNEDNGTPGYQDGEDTPWADQTVNLSNGDEATTGADGTYSFSDLPSDDYTVSFTNPDPDNLIFTDLEVDVEISNPNQAYAVDFVSVYRADNSVSGRVWLDLAADGEYTSADEPAAGFEITAENADLGLTFEAETDADGKYMFDGLRSGTWTITCVTCPAEFGGRSWTWTAPTDVELGEGADETVDFIGTVTGYNNQINGSLVIQDATGEHEGPWAVEGVEITVVGPFIPGAGDLPTETVMTDENGNWSTSDGLMPGNYEVTVDEAGVEAAYDVDLVGDATVVVSVPDELGAVATAPAFTFAINAYTITINTVYGPEAGPNMTYAGDLVALYQSEELDAGGAGSANLIGTATTAADGTVSFTAGAAISDDYVVYTSYTTLDALVQAGAMVLSDATIEHQVDPLMLEQTLDEDHNLFWNQVMITGRFVERDGDGVIDPIVVSPRVVLTGVVDLWPAVDTTALAGHQADVPGDDLDSQGNAVTEADGEFNNLVLSVTGLGITPTQIAAGVEVAGYGALGGTGVNLLNFTGDTGSFNYGEFNGSQQMLDVGDILVTYPNPDISGSVWHETNEMRGLQTGAGGDDFLELGDVVVNLLIDDDGDGAEDDALPCALDLPTGAFFCGTDQTAAGEDLIDLVDGTAGRRARIQVDAFADVGGDWRFIDAGDTYTADAFSAAQDTAWFDWSALMSDAEFEVMLGMDPFGYKFAANQANIVLWNENGPGLDDDGIRDKVPGQEVTVNDVIVELGLAEGLGVDVSGLPLTDTTAAIDAQNIAGKASFSGVLEGTYTMTIKDVTDSWPDGVAGLTIVERDAGVISYVPGDEYVITVDIQRTIADTGIKGEDPREVIYSSGSISGYIFDNLDDDDIVDPNERAVGGGLSVTASWTDGNGDMQSVSGTANGDGFFELDMLMEGVYTLSLDTNAFADGSPASRTPLPVREVDYFGGASDTDGDGTDLIDRDFTSNFDHEISGIEDASTANDTDIEMFHRDGQIKMTVLADAGGTPIANATVVLTYCDIAAGNAATDIAGAVAGTCTSPDGAGAQTFTTNAAGEITMTGLLEGFWNLDVTATGFTSGTATNPDTWVVRLLAAGDSEERTARMIP